MRKLRNILILLSILVFAFSCKKTNLTITAPGDDFFLDKMQNGSWDKVTVKPDGSISIDGKGDYKFEDSLLGVGGIYKGDNGYIIAAPGPDGSLNTIEVDEKTKNDINEIISIVGEENALGAMNGIVSGAKPGQEVDVDKIIGNSDVTDEERKKLEDLVNGLNNGSGFGEHNEYKPGNKN